MTTLDEVLAAEAAKQGRIVLPDPEPEKGYFYRSDHFELAKLGVPALHFLAPRRGVLGQAAPTMASACATATRRRTTTRSATR